MSSLSPILKPFRFKQLSLKQWLIGLGRDNFNGIVGREVLHNPALNYKPKGLGYIVLSLSSFFGTMVLGYPVQAQSSTVDVQFIPPPISNYDTGDLADRGAPDGREAAGTRGPCLPESSELASSTPSASPELTALIPTMPIVYDDATIQTPIGTTAKPHPTFFFYMPYTQQVVKAIQFTLMDAEDYPVASIDVPVPEQAGLLSVAWPTDQPPVPTAVDYRWLLQIDCHNPLQPSDPFTADPFTAEQFTTDLVVEGFIRRFAGSDNGGVNPPASQDVASLDAAAQLAASGLWNDALHVLISQLSGHPQPDTISIALNQLFTSVGLEGLTSYVDES